MQEVMKSIEDAPTRIKNSELKILDMTQKISSIKKSATLLRKETASVVAAETVEGKKVFTNAESREIETEKRLQENSQYQDLENQLTSLESEKAQEEIELQSLKNEYSSNKYRVRLCTADKMERAANGFYEGMKILAGLNNIFSLLQSQPGNTKTEPVDDCPF